MVTFSFVTPRSDQIQLLYEIETNIKNLQVFPKSKYLINFIVYTYLESKSSLKLQYYLLNISCMKINCMLFGKYNNIISIETGDSTLKI